MKLLNSGMLRKATFAAAISCGLLFPGNASAERLLTENFDYNTGNLYGQGNWLQYGSTEENPLQVVSSQLVYDGYQKLPLGKSVQFVGLGSQDQDLKKQISTDRILSGAVYVSALISVQTAPTGDVYALSLISPVSSGFTDKSSGTDNARMFLCKGDTEGSFKVGVGKNAANATSKSADLKLNTTYLVVMKYEIVDGTNNDICSVWVNPATDGTEPTTTLTLASGSDFSTTLGIQGVCLRQGTNFSKNGAEFTLGALRVANKWADLFDAGQGGGGETPEVSITATAAKFPAEFYLQGQTATTTVTVKATGITDDITVGGLASGAVTASATTIPAAEACAPEGYALTLTLDTKAGQNVNDVLTLTSGETATTVAVAATVYPVVDEARLSALALKREGDVNIYRYTGTMARVTFVDRTAKRFYLEDLTGALVFDYSLISETCPLNEGDKVKNIYCAVYEQAQGITVFYPLTPEMGTVTATGSFKTPTEVSLGEIKADPESYANRLVKITDVTFENVAEGATFTTAGIEISSPYMSGTATGRVRTFAGSDLIGTPVPAQATSITGISTSAAAAVISMRTSADLEAEVAAAALEVSTEMLIDANEYQAINVAVPFARLTVKTTDLPAAASVWIGGANRAMFSADVETVPAGTGTTVITVTYTPSTKGIHRATINFDATPTELSQTLSMSAKAYDPDNLPVLTVDGSALPVFTAAVGETQSAQFTYTSTGLLDYGTARVLGESNGAFIISSNTLLKDGTGTITVTFAPKSAGTYTERIELSADKAESVTITVSGTATGSAPIEDREGDELVFDESNPATTYTTDFTNAAANNKPVSLEGWKNVAMTGTRAWWSYTPEAGNQAAKATFYDSRAGENDGAQAQMMLLSPALDYKNCTNPLLTFRLRGDYLSDGMTEVLEVLYVDATDALNPYYEAIGGLNIPASSDVSGDWVDYVIDLDGLDLADTFHIAFRLSGERGRNSSAVYYVDDFSYGRDDVAFIRLHTRYVEMEAKTGQTATTEEIEVSGLNLTSPITLSMAGANPSKFTLSTTELPAEGGKFSVDFLSEDAGLHEAYVSLKSEGAPESLMPLYVLNKQNTGIDSAEVYGDATEASVYDMAGNMLCGGISPEDALKAVRSLEKAVYIIRLADSDGKVVKTIKYVRP